MFDYIGDKIKTCAKIAFVICVLGSLASAIAVAIISIDLCDFGGFGGFMVGLLFFVVFIIISYISVVFLYAYGELVENIAKISRNTDELARKINMMAEAQGSRPTVAQNPPPVNRRILSGPWRCKNCDAQNADSDRFCKSCGAPRD